MQLTVTVFLLKVHYYLDQAGGVQENTRSILLTQANGATYKLRRRLLFFRQNPVVDEGATILTVTENGYGKRTKTGEYRSQSRAGKGILTIKTTERNGLVVYSYQVTNQDQLMIITEHGKIIRFRVGDISVIGRNTQGVKLIDLGKGEKVVGVAKVMEE